MLEVRIRTFSYWQAGDMSGDTDTDSDSFLLVREKLEDLKCRYGILVFGILGTEVSVLFQDID